MPPSPVLEWWGNLGGLSGDLVGDPPHEWGEWDPPYRRGPLCIGWRDKLWMLLNGRLGDLGIRNW